MLRLEFILKTETKTCYRFEHKNEDNEIMTLYLKKKQVNEAGIDPSKGITITIKEKEA